jgi:nitronate monooxygenase
MWNDRRVLDLFGIELPILQAPMAGASFHEMAVAVAEAGGLGSLPCALLSPAQLRSEWAATREKTKRPIHLNFFCHDAAPIDAEREARWRERLAAFYVELGADDLSTHGAERRPFDAETCAIVEELRPEVVSFHFGLPSHDLLARVKAIGAKIVASATSVDEARWLDERGCDAIIAQGFEAGGHRGLFLTHDIAGQVGTMALVPQVVDAVKVPVIAAGGIADARGIVAAFALGASAVSIGTAYLFCPEAKIPPHHAAALRAAKDNETALTNVFSGRPARGIVNRMVREVGPMSALAPAFPRAAHALLPLRAKAEASGSGDFSPLWSGQAARLARREVSAGELTKLLARESLAILAKLGALRS